MSREKISSIIQRRKPFAKNIIDAKNSLDKILEQFIRLKGICSSALSDDSLTSERETVSEIFRRFNARKADELQAGMTNIHRRLSRDTLNIAVIGLARQGKSRLLQTITGLSPDVIPDSNGLVCTGVRSDIINDPDATETFAYVNFLSEEEFITNTVGKYFRELQKHKPGIEPPENITEFRYCQLPDKETFRTENIEDETRMRNYIGELRKLQAHLLEYQPYLGTGRSAKIPESEIRRYVIQNDPETGEEYHRHMAVESVEIHCKFPNQEVGALRLIDLPGLGDTRLGDTERMIEALADQVDLVFFVTMPRSTGEDVFSGDINLYSQARRALGRKLPIERWSFWVINHNTSSENMKQCQDFEQTLKSKDIHVAKTIIADCTNEDEVATRLIDEALSFLEANIERNDKEYAASLQEMMNQVVKNLNDVLSEAKGVFADDKSFEKDSELLDRLFDALLDELIDGLVGSVEPESFLGRRKNEPCTELREQFNNTLEGEEKAADDGKIGSITPEVVRKMVRRAGSPESAYANLMHQLRTELSGKMQQELDETLERVVLVPMKRELCKVLAENGKLGMYFHAKDEGILKEIIAFIEDGKKDLMPAVLDGLKKLDEATISCQNRIQPLIREALNLLDPMKEESRQRRAILTDAEGIYTSLIEIYRDTLATLRESLDREEIYSEPNEFAFATADNFVEDLVRRDSGASSLNVIKIDTQWRALYRYIRGEIWPEEFGNSQARTEAFAKISGPLSTVLTLCSNMNFNFSSQGV
ncbi:MAG: GTPase domain-containing protein [Synergistaceae bacterium]|nr:GTPase domain-containing protein [Synergistaceae bacterium]